MDNKKGWKEKLEEYGKMGMILYLSIFAITLVGFFVLLQLGFSEILVSVFEGYLSEEVITTSTGVFAYALTKITQPLRIVLTLALLPLIAKWRKKKIDS